MAEVSHSSLGEETNDINWKMVTIGDVADVKGGKRLPKGKSLKDFPTAFPYIRVSDFDSQTIDESNLKYLDEDTQSEIQNYTISKDDLYISIAGTIGMVGTVPSKLDGANLTENAAKICNIKGVDKNYFLYVLTSNFLKNQFEDKTTSSGQPKLALFRINGCHFPLPPLAEQKVIAEKLDTLLAQVDTTKARLERIPDIIKRFRQSVLAAAVSGKLTEEWRGDKEYEVRKIEFSSLILSSSVGLVRSSKEQFDDSNGKYPYIKMNNIDNFWGHNTDNIRFVEVSSEELSKYQLKKYDWLFNTRNSLDLVGKSCVWKEERECIYNNNILRVRFNDEILSDYIEIFIKSPVGQKLLDSLKSGTTNVAAIYQKQLFQLIIDLPNLKEQAQIVRRVEELFAFADSIEQKAAAALERVNNLTQSILAKAFRGELTADWRAANPELISGDNSAEALLAKIQAEREALKPVKKTRKKKAEA